MYTGIFDCCSGEFHIVNRFPFVIGSDGDVDLRLEGASIQGKQCQITQSGTKLSLMSFIPGGVFVNGQEVSHVEFEQNMNYPVQIGIRCFFMRNSNDIQNWGEAIHQSGWTTFKEGQPLSNQPMPLINLLEQFNSPSLGNGVVLIKEGVQAGFSVDALRQSFQEFSQNQTVTIAARQESQATPSQNSNPVSRRRNDAGFRCPHCWHAFAANEFVYVAKHPSLQNDPLLGPAEYLRFTPNLWEDGKPMDPKGEIADELACPECHRKLPRSIKNTKQHIISLVGDAASGKSYFLSVNTKILGDSFPKYFGTLFEDATPGENNVLRRMVDSLYGASSPEQVNIIKTQLYQDSYVNIKLKSANREVSMPKAFIFKVTKIGQVDCRLNLVFFDNAGEHFRPENDSVDNPGAQHVAAASGIMFLFDPFNHNDFKRAIRKHHNDDPQFENKTVDNITVILAEMKKRIEQLNNTDKIKAPLAFIVGKYDSWHQLIPEGEKFYEPREQNVLNYSAIKHNSDLTRTILYDISPGLVAQAESLSDNTMFFPVSNFGSSPVTIERDGDRFIVPDPMRLNPLFADIPVLWLTSQIDSILVPIR